jgi:AcrR family transcriptional regulator
LETIVIKQRKKAVLKQKGDSPADERAAGIYRVAAELITEKGFDATSMSEIAQAVNLTKAGLYYYVPGKKELLYSIVRYGMETIEEGVIAPCGLIEDPIKRLREVVRRHTFLLTEIGGSITILTDEINGLTPAHRRKMVEKKRAYLGFVRETLERIKTGGLLRSENVSLASMNLFSTILGVARWYQPDGPESGEEVAEEVADFVMAAVLKR